ncbi:hypothetical protein Tco_1151445, partial [Tanacetum coccineum]
LKILGTKNLAEMFTLVMKEKLSFVQLQLASEITDERRLVSHQREVILMMLVRIPRCLVNAACSVCSAVKEG